MNIVSVTRKRT